MNPIRERSNRQFNRQLARQLLAEGLGTALLLAMVVGSGIMGERLAGGNDALALLANSLATGAGLSVLILVFGPLSGAHFNPVVTLIAALGKKLPSRCAVAYVGAQILGAYAGVACAHLMFEAPLFAFSTHARSGWAQCGSEFVAAFGLLLAMLACARNRPNAVPYAVGAYITSAYWFTASTSFANPAVTLARALTDTFSGIAPTDISGFIGAQAAGAVTAWAVYRWLYGHKESLLNSAPPRPISPARTAMSIPTENDRRD